MNLILFEPDETTVPLPRSDARCTHLLVVLRRTVGDTFDAGIINGPRGKGRIIRLDAEAVTLEFTWGSPPSRAEPITLLVGLPRPQTARDILREATTLGVDALHFVATEKGDRSYAQSTLWSSGEWRRHLLDGAQQAFDPRIPDVTHGEPLADVLARLPAKAARLALDNYEADESLSRCAFASDGPVALAIGGERGWGPADRAVLRAQGFRLVHLGPRVLRTETAVIVALALVLSRTRLM